MYLASELAKEQGLPQKRLIERRPRSHNMEQTCFQIISVGKTGKAHVFLAERELRQTDSDRAISANCAISRETSAG
jgi:hypothetical protein